MSHDVHRHALVQTLFPTGIPRLWCPVLSHFQADGSVDAERTATHLEAIAPYVRGIMVPGSTGEGWDMHEAQIRELLTVVLRVARELDLRVLIGVLRKELDQMLAVIEGTVSWLCQETNQASGMAALLAANVVGFTVCPPAGSDLSADYLRDALGAVLELGHPTALYQLPQVTQNEMAPRDVAALADHYPNFYLLKDTSGQDRVALSGTPMRGVFLVRGAEGQYHRWLRTAGGPYDGYLLSSANCFARELAQIMDLVTSDADAAAQLSQRLELVIDYCFALVRDFPAANPFTNANKIIDHIMAFGDDAVSRTPPYLSNGQQLPTEFVQKAWEVLRQQQLLPHHGYC
jgi:dihydrodipicolinate synthase/N-acetylneuraminate lyase